MYAKVRCLMVKKAAGNNGKTAGIVAEYNPFHNGHKMMVDKLKNSGYSTVACVMSGCFVQRAEPAMLPVAQRTLAALQGGVDLVLRLPSPWAVSSAEAFSRAGVGLLWALGCVDSLAFGAETPDTDFLQAVAGVLVSPGFRPVLQKHLKTGKSFASARAAAADEILPGSKELLFSPNNILAVEYCKALLLREWGNGNNSMPAKKPAPLAIQRIGAQHDGPPENGISSASWIRMQARKGLSHVNGYVPQTTFDIMKQAVQSGDYLDINRWNMVLMGRLKGFDESGLSMYSGSGEGLAQRMAVAIKSCTGPEELYGEVKSKRFAHSRIRRLALNAALDFKPGLPVLPPFIHVLGASKKGLELLKTAKETAVIPVSSSLAKLRRVGPEEAKAAAMEERAEDIYAFCESVPKTGGRLFTQPLIILE